MLLDFFQLDKYFFNISNIFAEEQHADGKTLFSMHSPRATDALLLFSESTGICYQENTPPLYVPQGALVYIPKNSSYLWENSPAKSKDSQKNFLFEFILTNVDVKRGDKKELIPVNSANEEIHFGNKVCIVSFNHTVLYEKHFSKLIDAFDSENFSPLKVYNAAYDLFFTLSNNCKISHRSSKCFSLIKNSIEKLETTDKSIFELANECHISISYYERIFKNLAGMSPAEYRSINKINKIKSCLQKEMTLDFVAQQNGFFDSSYLCKFFKRKTGITPGEYRKIYFSQLKSEDKNEEINK